MEDERKVLATEYFVQLAENPYSEYDKEYGNGVLEKNTAEDVLASVDSIIKYKSILFNVNDLLEACKEYAEEIVYEGTEDDSDAIGAQMFIDQCAIMKESLS